MIPAQLKPEQFAAYPPLARRLAIDHLDLLRRMPLAYLPLFLREVAAYDWKFPAERREVDLQFAFLAELSPQQAKRVLAGFDSITLSRELESMDWVNSPAAFSEDLSAHLWATHQMDAFRAASIQFVDQYHATAPAEPLAVSRLAIVLVGEGLSSPGKVSSDHIFQKLRPSGVHFTQVDDGNGLETITQFALRRARQNPIPYGHWYIDGDAAPPELNAGLTCVDYRSLGNVRAALLSRIRSMFASGAGPEAVRSVLFQLQPQSLGMSTGPEAGVIDHFRISLLTEGSGTQIFSTTFVQWAAREALRRAQPVTLVSRFAPRQAQRSMEEMLSGGEAKVSLDPEGSLIDADMGAYYTWLNLQRLPGSERASLLVWLENSGEALAISPRLGRAETSTNTIALAELLAKLT
jgi:hypothetical protein